MYNQKNAKDINSIKAPVTDDLNAMLPFLNCISCNWFAAGGNHEA
jgi:hypothetical protein